MIPDGMYDNTKSMRRELYRDGELAAWWTAMFIEQTRKRSGSFKRWGVFPPLPPCDPCATQPEMKKA